MLRPRPKRYQLWARLKAAKDSQEAQMHLSMQPDVPFPADEAWEIERDYGNIHLVLGDLQLDWSLLCVGKFARDNEHFCRNGHPFLSLDKPLDLLPNDRLSRPRLSQERTRWETRHYELAEVFQRRWYLPTLLGSDDTPLPALQHLRQVCRGLGPSLPLAQQLCRRQE